MTDDQHRFHPTFPRTTPALQALKTVVAAQAARDAALASFVEAERRLYDAQEELKAVRKIGKALH